MNIEALVKYKLLRPGALLPKRGTVGSGGIDIYAPEGGCLQPGESRLIPSGVAHSVGSFQMLVYAREPGEQSGEVHPVYVPMRLQGVIFSRSGLGAKHGIQLSFTPLIDNDYRGEILLYMENTSSKPFSWSQGERLCQMAYIPMYDGLVEAVDSLDDTERGTGGFGSTGK